MTVHVHSLHTVDPGKLADLIEHGPAHLRPVLKVVRDCGAVFAIISPGRTPFKIPSQDGPLILAVDDRHEAGPKGFHEKSLGRAFAGTRMAVVISSGPEAAPYCTVALAAALLGKAVLVETLPAQEAAWISFIRRHAPRARLVISTPYPEKARQADKRARMEARP